MDVLMLSPAYPAEMPGFTRGLAEIGARVWGVGDTPEVHLPEGVRRRLSGYLQVPRVFDLPDTRRRVLHWLQGRRPDRVESLWEPLVLLAAQLREDLHVPGMRVDTVRGFRDKGLMKTRIARAGLRVPHARRARTIAGVWEAAEDLGYPLIVKPISGAGSADTHRVDDPEGLARILPSLRHVDEVSVEEFVDGREFTYDTLCVDGLPVYENVAEYLPRPLIARSHESISPIITTVKDLSQPHIRKGVALGRGVLQALGMGSGFTHMEWYLTASGEVVFGEIGCRPGGARLVDQMNFTSDIDVYRGWATAVCAGHFDQDATRHFNVPIIFKRARGVGRIQRVEGLDAFLREHPASICTVDLLPVGSHRRDWTQTLVSDGYVILRHPDWEVANNLARRFAEQVQLYAS